MILALKEALSHALQDGALIITATRRLAKQWQPILVSDQVSVSPRIISQKDWFNELWSAVEACGLTANQYLLTPIQEIMLWKKIIESSSRGERLLRLQATAKSVAQALELLKQWQLSLESIEAMPGFLTEEANLFLSWAKELNSVLRAREFITQGDLPDVLIKVLGQQSRILASYSSVKKIKLLGFEDIPPQLQAFYAHLKKQGWDITELQCSEKTLDISKHHKYAFYDQAEELRSAALWARELKKKVNYSGAIGIVVPDLAQCRLQVAQIFTEVLEPLTELKAQQSVSDQFNISVALPLSSYPIVFAALKAFVLLDSEKVDLNDLLFFIRSPFMSLFDSDLSQRAQYSHTLKQIKKQKLHFSEYNLLEESFFKLSQFKKGLPFKTTVVHWAQIFEQFLKLIGWPGERVLNSIEHQAMGRWQILLEEFSALDKILEVQDLQGAIKLLTGLANEIPFQGQSKPASIHIMGILEASSQPFEYLWVTGLHNEAWPPIPRANPFLPIAIQRSHQMPHASSEREYAFSKKLTDNLKNVCESVIFSYFKNDTVKSYQPSDLISEYPEEKISFEPYFVEIGPLKNRLESILDDKGPMIEENQLCKGGASLIQSQAMCQFKAFAQYRLHASEPQRPVVGMDSKDRGILVHKILESLWGVIKTHQNLCDYQEDKLDLLIDKVIAQHIKNIVFKYDDLMTSFWEVEHWRLKNMIKAWFELEKKRDSFSVMTQEHSATVHLAGLQFKIKIDRVDKSQNNEVIIIDYKTSDQNLAECLEVRPGAPQLPLYCVSMPWDAKAVVFGEVQAQGCKWVGMSESHEMLAGVKAHANWDALLMQWKDSLESLALEFKSGQAKVYPYKGDKSCRQCHLLQVCRLKSVEHG